MCARCGWRADGLPVRSAQSALVAGPGCCCALARQQPAEACVLAAWRLCASARARAWEMPRQPRVIWVWPPPPPLPPVGSCQVWGRLWWVQRACLHPVSLNRLSDLDTLAAFSLGPLCNVGGARNELCPPFAQIAWPHGTIHALLCAIHRPAQRAFNNLYLNAPSCPMFPQL